MSADTSFGAGYAAGTSASLPVSASANWDGDRVHLQSDAGAPLPSTVRLGFAIGFHSVYPGQMSRDWATLTATFNGKTASLDVGNRELDPTATTGFDSVAVTPNYVHQSGATFVADFTHLATFHLDLPIGPDGISDPFQLGLTKILQNRAIFP